MTSALAFAKWLMDGIDENLRWKGLGTTVNQSVEPVGVNVNQRTRMQ